MSLGSGGKEGGRWEGEARQVRGNACDVEWKLLLITVEVRRLQIVDDR